MPSRRLLEEFDSDKLAEAALALLSLTLHDDGRVWKALDWDLMDLQDLVVHAYADTAWAEFYWDFVGRLRSDGNTLMTHGRESQVYRKTDGRWRLVHVHYSGMPAAAER